MNAIATWTPLDLRCPVCGRRWTEYQPTGVAIKIWAAYVCSLSCESCGPHSLLFVDPHPDPPTPLDEPVLRHTNDA